MSVDPMARAIEAAAEALAVEAKWCDDNKTLRDSKVDAHLAVEAAAPHLTRFQDSLLQIAQERAERAEAEVERLRLGDSLYRSAAEEAMDERALADRLAEALRDAWSLDMDCDDYDAALAAYEEARREV